MSRLRNEIDAVRAHARSLWGVIGLLVLVIAGQQYVLSRMPREITLRYPPDLRSGAVLGIDEVPPADAYVFAYYLFQQLNHWPEDGEQDYGANLYRLAPYLTPRFRAELITEMQRKGRRGELTDRVRAIQAVPGTGYEERRVEVLGNGAWVVWLDLALDETVRGMPVKQTAIRYPLRVVRYAVDADANPWGLALDGYAGEGPRRLSDEEIHTALAGEPPKEGS